MNTPIVKWIFPFMFGIIGAVYLPIQQEWIPIGVCIGLAILLWMLTYVRFFHSISKRIFAYLFLLEALFIGYSITLLHQPHRNPNHYSHYASSCKMITCVVDEMPTQSLKSVKSRVQVTRICTREGWLSTTGKLMVFFQKDSLVQHLQYGDELFIKTNPTPIAAPQNPYQFNYQKYLERKQILCQAYVNSGNYRILKQSSDQNVYSFAYRLRAFLIHTLQNSGLSKSEQAIASAILLGWDVDVDAETLQKFSNAGISHFLCVSGLHLGIISLFIGYCFFFLGNSKRNRIIKGCIQLVGLWFFAMITGLAPSVMRAATMFSLIVIGKMFFTRTNFCNNVATSAFILLLFDPLLLYDVGFQLSYSGVLGIVLLQPHIKNIISIPEKISYIQRFPNEKGTPVVTFYGLYSIERISNAVLWLMTRIWEYICVSLAAQLATLPFTIYYFHQFPVYFLIANVLIIPFAGILLGTVIFVILCSWIPLVKSFITGLLSLEIIATNHIVTWVSTLPKSMIDNIYFDEWILFGSIFLIIGFSHAFIKQKNKILLLSIGILISFVLYTGYISYRTSTQQKWIIYSVRNHLVLEFIIGNASYFVSDTIVLSHWNIVDFSIKNYRIRNQIKNQIQCPLYSTYSDSILYMNGNFIAFEKDKIGIISPNNAYQVSTHKLYLDYLILTENPNISISKLSNRFHFKHLIFAPTNTSKQIKKWEEECDSLQISYYGIANQGALENRLY